jgi:hypothetical protein
MIRKSGDRFSDKIMRKKWGVWDLGGGATP